MRAFTKDRRKLGLMALKIQIFISKLLAEYYILRLFCILRWTSFRVFFYAKIINHAVEREVELKHTVPASSAFSPSGSGFPSVLHKTARSTTKGIGLKTLPSLLEKELSYGMESLLT